MKNQLHYLSILLLCAASVLIFGLQFLVIGWTCLILGILTLFFCDKACKRDLFLLYFSIIVLSFTPITTNLSYLHIVQMGVGLIIALFVPYYLSHYIYKDNLLRFLYSHKKNWTALEVGYLLLAVFVAYITIPLFLTTTGSYLNWSVHLDFDSLFRLFLGTNLVGAWDELFFICTALAIMKRFLPFAWADVAQATMFTAFLYELGFRGWGVGIVFIFALIQGFIFHKTKSLAYVVAIHLSIDLILFLALIHTHYPHVLPIFIT